jgi:hypothetical protein
MWENTGKAIAEHTKVTLPHSSFGLPETFVPACTTDDLGQRQYQVVIFKKDDTMQLGVVMEVFRGSIVKPKGEAKAKAKAAAALPPLTRTMRSTKGVTFPLQCTATARIKVSTLHRSKSNLPGASSSSHWLGASSTSRWHTSVVEPRVFMDPLLTSLQDGAGVVGHIKVKKVISENFPELILDLPRNVDKLLNVLQDLSIDDIPWGATIPYHSNAAHRQLSWC